MRFFLQQKMKENESDFHLPAHRGGGSLTVFTSSSSSNFINCFPLLLFLETSSGSLSSFAEQHRQLQQLQLPPLFNEQKSSEVPVVMVVMELLLVEVQEVSESSGEEDEDDELWW